MGSYLFRRISADGSDSRFDTIRTSPPKFLIAFFLQATWVSLCLMPVLAVNSLPASLFSALPASVAVTDVIGLLLYAGGLGFEVVADRQKDRWVQDKRAKKHDEDFLTHGLWSKSRHPNYFGEATLWTGIAVVAGGVLARNAGQVGMGLAKGWAAGGGGAAKAAAAAAAAGATMGISWKGRALGIGLAAVSPAFVTALLLFGSGVPMSEKKYDKKYGHRQDYQDWKRNTPVFWPKF